MPKIDQILNEYGYRKYVLNAYISCFLCKIIFGLVNTQFNVFLITLIDKFEIGPTEINIFSALLLLTSPGSIISGYASKYMGRPLSINLFLILALVFNLMSGFANNFVMFTIYRLATMFFVGMIQPQVQGLCVEYLPSNYRAFMINLLGFGHKVGLMMNYIFVLIIMPNFEVSKYKNCMLVISSICFLFSIFLVLTLKESPRTHIVNGREKEAFFILEEMIQGKLSNLEKSTIISEVNSSVNSELKGQISELFNRKFLLTTVILLIAQSMIAAVNSGLRLIIGLTLQKIEINFQKLTPKQNLVNQIVIALFTLPAIFISALITEVSYLKHKGSTIICCFGSAVFVGISILFINQFSILFGIGMLFITASQNVLITYNAEIYPTKIRDISVGFMLAFSRVSSQLGQILFLQLHTIKFLTPYYFTTIIMVVIGLLIMFLPYETNEYLDTELEADDKII